ncbi:hypothetical protein [Pantoea ananatis]|uniref:hypothetical protein n=1 Tax=Pantoea ananas TaxID=553 RepID=UPI001B311A6C|nr:hypothetical protein [Pantoea ananatis]
MKHLSSGQIAYLNRAVTDGEGLIEIGELAKGLGKQKGNIIRKLENSFDDDQLFKMKTCLTIKGNGQKMGQEVTTYMLDYKTAGALAMSYDLQLGIEVLTILEDSLKTIEAMTIEAAKGNTAGVLREAASFSERYRARLEYRPGASENEDRSTALKRLGRKGL